MFNGKWSRLLHVCRIAYAMRFPIIFLLILFIIPMLYSANCGEVSGACNCGDMVVENYTMTYNLNCTDTGLIIGANDLVLDCAGYSINYSMVDIGNGIEAIGRNNITIKNCRIIQQNESITSTDTDYSNATFFSFTNFSFIQNVNISPMDPYGRGLILLNSTSNEISLSNITCSIMQGCYAFTLAGSFNNSFSHDELYLQAVGSRGIFFEKFSYNNSFYNITINATEAITHGIYTEGPTYNNTFTKFNITMAQSTGIFMTTALYIGGPTYNNTFTNFTATLGGYGGIALINNPTGPLDDNIFYNFYVYIETDTAAISSGSTMRRNRLSNFTLFAYTSSGYAMGMYVVGDDNIFQNFKIFTNGTYCEGVDLSGDRNTFSNFTINTSGEFSSSLKIADSANNSFNNILMNLSLENTPHIFLTDGSSGNNFTNLTFQGQVVNHTYMGEDGKYSGNNFLLNCTNLNRSGISYYSADNRNNITVQWYARVNVTDHSGTAIGSASVSSINNQSIIQNFGTTQNDGNTSWIIVNDTLFRGAGGDILYSMHNFTANKTGYTTNSTNATVNSSMTIHLILSGGPMNVSCGDLINTSTTMANDINCSGTGLIINNDSVVLDCAGHSINFSMVDVGNGIRSFGKNNITIKNCIIYQQNTSMNQDYANATFFYNTNNSAITNITILVKEDNVSGIIIHYGNYNNLSLISLTGRGANMDLLLVSQTSNSIFEHFNVNSTADCYDSVRVSSGNPYVMENNTFYNFTINMSGLTWGGYPSGLDVDADMNNSYFSNFTIQVYDRAGLVYGDEHNSPSDYHVYFSNFTIFVYSNGLHYAPDGVRTFGGCDANFSDFNIITYGLDATGVVVDQSQGHTFRNFQVTTNGSFAYGLYIDSPFMITNNISVYDFSINTNGSNSYGLLIDGYDCYFKNVNISTRVASGVRIAANGPTLDSTFSQHNLSNVLVDGRPVYYYKTSYGLDCPASPVSYTNASFVGFSDCDDIVIENSTISDGLFMVRTNRARGTNITINAKDRPLVLDSLENLSFSNINITTNCSNCSGIRNIFVVNSNFSNSNITTSSTILPSIHLFYGSENLTFTNITFLGQFINETYFGDEWNTVSGNNYLVNPVNFNTSAIGYHDADRANNITLQWYVRVNATDQSGTAINGASANCTNNQSRKTSMGTTAADGYTNWYILNDTMFRGAGGNIIYSMHNFTANKTGYFTNSTNDTINQSMTLNLMLGVPSCGMTLTQNTTLDSDLNCSTNGLIIGANDLILDCAGHAIEFARESEGNGIQAVGRNNITIKNCRIFQQNDTFNNTDGMNATFFFRTNYSSVANLTIITMANYSFALSVFNSKLNSFLNNSLITYGYKSYGTYLNASSSNNSLSNFSISTNGSEAHGAQVWSSSNNSLSNFNISTNGSYAYGVWLSSSSNNTLSNFNISTNGSETYGAILYSSSNYNSLSNFTISITGYNAYGAYLYISSNNNFLSNFNIYTKRDESRGARLDSSSNYNTLSNFNISTNGSYAYGVWLSSSSNNTLSNFNIFTNGSFASGAYLYSSSNNSLSNFTINTTQTNAPKVYFFSCSNNTISNSTFIGQPVNQTYLRNLGMNTLLNITGFNRSALSYYDSPAASWNVTVQWYARVNVTDTSDIAISGASVSSVNNQSITQNMGTTQDDGNTSWFVMNDTMFRGAGGDVVYSNHQFIASKTGYVTNSTNETINESKTVHVILGSPNAACGDTITSSKTLNTDLNCTDTGLIMGADSITLDCNWHTIEFARVTYGNGISADGRLLVTIKNCILLQQNATVAPPESSYFNGTFFSNVNDSILENMIIRTLSNETRGISFYFTKNLTVNNITINNTGYDSDGFANAGNATNSQYTNLILSGLGESACAFAENKEQDDEVYFFNNTMGFITTYSNSTGLLLYKHVMNNTFANWTITTYDWGNGIEYNTIISGEGADHFVQGNNFTNFTITTWSGKGVYFIYGPIKNTVSNFNITTYGGGTGVHFSGGSGIVVQTYDNVFRNFIINTTNNSARGLDVENWVRNNTFRNFTITTSGSLSYGIYTEDAGIMDPSNTTFVDFNITTSNASAIYLTGASDYDFLHNFSNVYANNILVRYYATGYSLPCPSSPLNFSNASFVGFVDCSRPILENSTISEGVLLVLSNNAIVRNTSFNTKGIGVNVFYGYNVSLRNLTITTNGSSAHGIYLSGETTNSTVADCSITTYAESSTGLLHYSFISGDVTNVSVSFLNITTYGDFSHGIYIPSDSHLTNSTFQHISISTNGSKADGLNIYYNAPNNVFNNMTIYAIGSDSKAISQYSYSVFSNFNRFSNLVLNSSNISIYLQYAQGNTFANVSFLTPTNLIFINQAYTGNNTIINFTNLNRSAITLNSTSNTANLTLQWYVRLNISDSSRSGIEGASGNFTNNQSRTGSMGTTTGGLTSWYVLNDTMLRGAGGNILYSMHNFTANKTGYTTNSTNATVNSSMTIHLILSGGPMNVSCGDLINTSTTMANDINCSGTGLIINNDSVVLDCAGHYINFSIISYGNGIEAIGRNNITIKNCRVYQHNSSMNEWYSNCTYLYLTNNSAIENMTFEIYENNIDGIVIESSRSNSIGNISFYGVGEYNYGIMVSNSSNSTYKNIFTNGSFYVSGIYLLFNVYNSSFYNVTCNGSGVNNWCLHMGNEIHNNSFVKFNSTIDCGYAVIVTDAIFAEQNVYNNTFRNFTITNTGWGDTMVLDVWGGFVNNTLDNFDITAFSGHAVFYSQGEMDGNRFSNFNINQPGYDSSSSETFDLSYADNNIFSNFTIISNGSESIIRLDQSSGNIFNNFTVIANESADSYVSECFLIHATDSSFNKFNLLNLTTVNLTGVLFEGTQLNHFRHNLSDVYINNVIARHYATGYSIDCPSSALNFTNASYLGFAGCPNLLVENTIMNDVLLLAFSNNSIIRNVNISHDGSGLRLYGGLNNNSISDAYVTAADGYGFYASYESNPFINNSFSNLNISMGSGTALYVYGSSGVSMNTNFSNVSLSATTSQCSGGHLYYASNLSFYNFTSKVDSTFAIGLRVSYSNDNTFNLFNVSNLGTYACCIDPNTALYLYYSSNSNRFFNGFFRSDNSQVYKVYITGSAGNNFTNITFLGSINQTRIYYSSGTYPGNNIYLNFTNLNKSAITFAGTSSNRNNLTVQWYVRLNITDSSGTGIEGASGNFTNNQSRTGEMGATTGGLTNWIILNDTMFRHSGGNLIYSNHNFTANKTNYITNSTNETVNQSMTINIRLALGATTVSCGDLINQSTTMANDLNCSGTGLIINNDSVVLDCAGHYINYSIISIGNGIEAVGRNNITIRNCTIRQENPSIGGQYANATFFFATNSSRIEYVNMKTTRQRCYGISIIYSNETNVSNAYINVSSTIASYGIYTYYSTRTIVSNSNLISYGDSGAGFNSYASENNTLTNSNISAFGNNAYGVFLSSSMGSDWITNHTLNFLNINITGNKSLAIYMRTAVNNNLSNLNISVMGMGSNGVYMWVGNSTFENVSMNVVNGSGFYIYIGGYQYFHGKISNSNINGKPILFYDSWHNPCPDNQTLNFSKEDYSFIGFVGCKNITVANSTLNETLYFALSSNISVYNTSISSYGNALQFVHTNNIKLDGLNLSSHGWYGYSSGLIASWSNYISASNLNLSRDTNYSGAIWLDFSSKSNISNSYVNCTNIDCYHIVFSRNSNSNNFTNITFLGQNEKQIYFDPIDFFVLGNNSMINGTNLNKSSIVFANADPMSNITIKWYVRFNITDGNGNPISGASINSTNNQSISEDFGVSQSNGLTDWFVLNDTLFRGAGGDIVYSTTNFTVNKTIGGISYINSTNATVNQTMTLNIILGIPSCGQTLTQNTTLDYDLNCSATAITIGANDLIFDCAGHAIEFARENIGNGIQAVGRNNITIKNCRLFQQNDTFNNTAGMNGTWFFRTNNSLVQNVSMYTKANYSFGIVINESKLNNLINNTLITNGYRAYGVWLYSSINNSLSNFTISTNGSNTYATYLFSSSNNTFTNFNINTSRIYAYGTYLFSSSNNNFFSNFTISTTGSNAHGTYLSSSSNYNSFSNFSITTRSSSAQCLDLSSSSYNSFFNFSVATTVTGHGAKLLSSSNNSLFNFTISVNGSSSDGIYLQNSENNSLSNISIFMKDSSSDGIYFWSSSNNSLSNFTIFTNGTNQGGVSIWESSQNIYTGFSISTFGETSSGASLYDSHNNSLSNFTIYSNGTSSDGLLIYESENNSLSNFTIYVKGSLSCGTSLYEYSKSNSLSYFTINTTNQNSPKIYYIFESTNNTFANVTFLGQSINQTYIADSGETYHSGDNFLLNITNFNHSAIFFNDPDNRNNISLQWYVKVNVSFTNGTPVIGASVNATNNQSIFQNFGATGADGLTTSWAIMNDTMFRGAGGDIVYSTTNFTANYSAYINSSNFTINNSQIITIYLSDISAPHVFLEFPENNNITSSTTMIFNCSGIDDVGLSNITLFIWNSTNGLYYNNTQSSLNLQNSSSWTLNSIPEDIYNWTCNSTDLWGNTRANGTNRTFKIDTSATVISLNSPINRFNTSLQTINFNCSATDSGGLANITIFIWNSSYSLFYNKTANVSNNDNSTNWTLSNIPEGRYNWTCNASDASGNNGFTVNYTFTVDLTPPSFVQLVSPQNNLATALQTLSFNCSGMDNFYLSNFTLIIWNSTQGLFYNNTKTATGASNYSNWTIQSIPEGVYNWTCNASDNVGNGRVNETNRTFTIDMSATTVVLNSPENDYSTSSTTVQFSCSGIDSTGLSNITLFIWNSTNSLFYLNTTDVSNQNNESIWSVSGFTLDTYNWTCNASDVAGNEGSTSNRTFTVANAPTPPSPDDEKKNMNVQVIANYTNNPITIIAKDKNTHIALSNALATLTYNSVSIASCFTNSSGTCQINAANPGIYYVRVTRAGYNDVQIQIELLKYGCASNDECNEDEICKESKCEKITGECGFAKNHAWINYECCVDSQCSNEYYCTNNICKKVEGECGYISNHKWINYECCKNSDCASGETCTNNKCTQESTSGNSNGTCSSEGKKCGTCCTGLVCKNGICAKESTVQPSGNESFNYTKPIETNETNKTINIGQIIPIRIGIKDACDGIIEAEVDTTTYLICCNIYYALFILSVLNSFVYYRKRRDWKNSLLVALIPFFITLVSYPYVAFIASLMIFAYLARMDWHVY